VKLRNFDLSNIDLEQNGEVYDLHNNFDFVGFCYEILERKIELNWRLSSGEWVPDELPASIVIIISEVSHFSAIPRDPLTPFTEDDCLECVAFVEENGNTADSYVVNSPANNELHYVFHFMSGLKLRIQAGEAECTINA